MSDTKFLVGISFVLLIAGAPLALGQAPAVEPLAMQVKRCAAVADAKARLVCYDALGSSMAAASTLPHANTPAVADSAPPEVPPETPGEFGVRNGPLQAKLHPVLEKRMLAVVSEVSNRPRGELVVKLDNGQVWTQIQPATYPLKPGDHIEIDVASLGSYLLWCPSTRRATKVTRIL